MYKRKCKITFVKHGSTINTEQDRLLDDENYPPLNEKGRLEIEALSDWLIQRSPKVDKIYCATSLRCIQSARIITKKFKYDFDVIEGLEARKAGAWSGYTFEQIEKEFSQNLENYHQDPTHYWVEGGENTIEMNERIQKTISKLIEENLGKRLIVITHGDVIQSAISQALEVPPANQTKIYIPTGSASQISYYKAWNSLLYSGYIPL